MPTISIRWADNTAELKKNLAAGLDQIEATKAGVDKLASSLRGDNLIAAANKYAAAVQQIGGASNLTAANQQRVNDIMSRAVDQLNAAGRGGSDLAKNFKALADETDQAEGKTNLFVSALEGLGHSFVARVAEGVLLRDAVREFLSVLRDAVTDAAKFEDLSKAMGMSVEDVQRFNYVAPEFGLNVEEMARGVEQLSAKLANGDKNATSAVQMLGLNVKQLLAQSPKDAFLEVAEAVGKIEDPTTKIGVATELWGGKLAKTLLPALGELRQKLNDVPKDAIISDANVEKAHDFDVGLQHLTTTLKAYAATVLSLPGKVLDLAGQGEMGLEGFQPNGSVGPTPSSGGGADIALPGAQRTIDNATLIKNKLDALRTDALEPLSAAQKNQIVELKQWGEGEADIAKLVGAGEAAVHRYAEAQKTAATAQKEFDKAEADIEALMQGTDWDYTITGALKVGASVHDVAVVFGTSEGAVEKNKQALRTWAEIAKIAADAHPLEGMLKDLPNVTVASDVLIQRTEQLVRAQALERVGLSEFSDGIEKVGRSFKETDNDIADAIAEFGFIGPTLDQAQLGVQSFGESLRNDLGKTLDTLPSLLQQAFTGGGGIKGAIQALGAGLGADLGRNLATKFGDTITAKLTDVLGQKMGDAFGGLINKLLPGMGALVGAGLQEVFTLLEGKPEWQKIGDDIGRDLGVHISDSTAKAIAASEKTVQDALVKQLTEAAKAGSEAAARQLADITSASPARRQRALADTRPAAEELNLPQIISDAGGLNSTNLDEFTHKLRDVFSELEDGTITTALATKVLDDNWKAFVDAATDGDGRISAGLKEIIRLNAQFGTQSKEIAAFLKQQGQDAEAGFAGAADALLAPYAAMHEELQQNRDAVNKLVADGKTGTDEWKKAVQQLNDVANKTWQNFTTPDKIAGTTQQLRDLGTLAVATFSAAVAAGTPFYDALAAAAPQITQVYDAFQDLGIAIDDDAFSELALQAKILGTNKALVQGAADLGKMIVALDNMGLMNAQTFQSTERTAMAMYTRIQGEVVKVGGSTRDALLPMQDYLHKAAAEAALLGVPLDENTQILIDQSKELGIWKEAGKSAAQQQKDSTDALTAAIDNLTKALLGIPNVDFTVTQHNRQVLDDTVGNAASLAASILAGQNGEAPEAQPGAGGATGGLVADLVRGFQPRSFAAGGPVGYSMPILPPQNPSDTQLIWTNPNEWIFDRPRQAVILSQLQAGASMAEFVRDTVQALTVQAPGTGSDTADEHTTIVQGVIDGQVLMEVQARRLARNKPGARAFKASLGVK